MASSKAWRQSDCYTPKSGEIVRFYDGSGKKILMGRRVPGGIHGRPKDILVQATLGRGFGRRRTIIVIKPALACRRKKSR